MGDLSKAFGHPRRQTIATDPFFSNMLLGTFREVQVVGNTCLPLAYSLFRVTQY